MDNGEEYVGVMDYSSLHLKMKQALESLCTIIEDSAFKLTSRVRALQAARLLVEGKKDLSEDEEEERAIVEEAEELLPPKAMEEALKVTLAERARKVADELEFFDEYFPTMPEVQHFRGWADAVERSLEKDRDEKV